MSYCLKKYFIQILYCKKLQPSTFLYFISTLS